MGLTGPVLFRKGGKCTRSAHNWPGQNISRTSKEVQEKTQNPHGYQQKVKNVPGLSDGWQAAGWSKVERGHVQVAQEKIQWESGWELIWLEDACHVKETLRNMRFRHIQQLMIDTSAKLCGWWQEHMELQNMIRRIFCSCAYRLWLAAQTCKNINKRRAAVISVPFHCKISYSTPITSNSAQKTCIHSAHTREPIWSQAFWSVLWHICWGAKKTAINVLLHHQATMSGLLWNKKNFLAPRQYIRITLAGQQTEAVSVSCPACSNVC